MASAWVAGQRGFPGYDGIEAASVMHTKGLFRRFTEEHAIRAPRSVRLGAGSVVEAADAGGLRPPYLVKPVDSFSGRGVTRVGEDQRAAGHGRSACSQRSRCSSSR